MRHNASFATRFTVASLFLWGAGCAKVPAPTAPAPASADTGVIIVPTPTPTPTGDAGARPVIVVPVRALGEPGVHRAAATACPAYTASQSALRADASGCHSNADCRQGRNGRCVQRSGGRGRPYNACEFDGCMSDRECSGNQVCNCNYSGNRCMQANCKTDAQCGAGQYCAQSDVASNRCHPASGTMGWFCTTPRDECRTRDDCAGTPSSYSGKACLYDGAESRWKCVALMCRVG